MKPTKATIVRTIVLLIALTNQLLVSIGKNPFPFADETISEFLSLAFAIGAAVVSWWKNNSFTKAAITADDYMKKLKK